MATYTISVHLGRPDIDVVDIVSEVYLTMFGTKASSPELGLDGTCTVPAAGAPGATGPPTYEVDVADLGDIQRVRVRHDDTGVGPGCYLDRIVVRAAGTLQEWTFLCQRWLARHEDDGATERTLDALTAGGLSGALFPPIQT